MAVKTGKVKWFDKAKRFGFICPDNGTDDVFVHISAVTRAGRDTLTQGQVLGYCMQRTDKGWQATNLQFIEESHSGSPGSSGSGSAARRPESTVSRKGARGSGSVRKRGTGGGGRSQVNQNTPRLHTVTCYTSGGEGLKFDTGHQARDRRGNPVPVKVESLKVTDRFLAARPGSVYEKTRSDLKLVQYAPDVSQGLEGEPDIDENPYNFVPWTAPKPSDADDPSGATHDEMRPNRLSGSIKVTFTARTPVFVPAGEIREQSSTGTTGGRSQPQDFFHCWDGRCEKYAIPGASVKGVVRSLFEALTNSRAGVTDESALRKPPLYRRRAFRLFKITQKPSGPGKCGKVQECDYGLSDDHGNWNPKTKTDLPDPAQNNKVKEIDFSANLFWVGSKKHKHRWKRIRYKPNGKIFDLHWDTMKRFLSMEEHPHLEAHGGPSGNAASASRPFYCPPPPNYSSVKDRLFKLCVGDLVFGIPRNGRLHCFGRNVNFLWPADRSALELMGKFASRKPENQGLSGSDPSEATFGFAGAHGDGSHPFRSRVRFGTFWGPAVSDDDLSNRPCLRLMPLTAPSGTKAKSRPLYLNPRENGQSADHDENAKLRGRKFYWHQKGENDNVPSVHRFDELSSHLVAEKWKDNMESQLPTPIRPLPACTTFTGKIHFSNLTDAELGALLIALKPDLAFEESDWKKEPRYGIKIGKGKPRGLGSITSDLKLQVDDPPGNMYSSLDVGSWRTPDDEAAAFQQVKNHVCSYKKWMAPDNGTDWNDLGFAKALKRLLRLPRSPSARVYPPQFMMYGWLPKDNDPDGSPRGQRPKAMTPATKMNSTRRQ